MRASPPVSAFLTVTVLCSSSSSHCGFPVCDPTLKVLTRVHAEGSGESVIRLMSSENKVFSLIEKDVFVEDFYQAWYGKFSNDFSCVN